MIANNVPTNIVRWLKNFINDRYIHVLYKGAKSKKREMRAGVAQGTITAPTIFKVALNKLYRDLVSNSKG
jgi:hypothetical protein